jgi:hypothetical protein
MSASDALSCSLNADSSLTQLHVQTTGQLVLSGYVFVFKPFTQALPHAFVSKCRNVVSVWPPAVEVAFGGGRSRL